MLFFMVGLSFKNPIVVFGIDFSLWIAVALSISNTIIQIIGNDQEQEGLGMALWVGWIGSYCLGIGTNVVGLLAVLSIENVYLEWIIAIGLGTMIEVLPEKLVVVFLKSYRPIFGNRRKRNDNYISYPRDHTQQSQLKIPDISAELKDQEWYKKLSTKKARA